MRRRHRPDLEEGADSITTFSTDDNCRNSEIDTYSDRNSSSGSELSELAIHALLETRAEETCDHLINTWVARHGCPMTFQSDNGTAFVGEPTKELMRHSQVAQAHSTTYHPQTKRIGGRNE